MNSLCVDPPSSIYFLPKWEENDKFAYSATDVLSWVRSESIGLEERSHLRMTQATSPSGRDDLRCEKRDGLFSIDSIRDLYLHTKRLAIRFNLDGSLPNPKSPLMIDDAIDMLNVFEDILKKFIATDRYKRRNQEFYELALSLRGYATTLRLIIGVADRVPMLDENVKAWVDKRSQDISQCRDEIARISEVARPESIPLDWRQVVATAGTEASKLVRTLLDVSGENITSNWAPDLNSVKCIRDAQYDIQKWSETFSIQADESPAVATGKPIAKRDAPAGKSNCRGGRPGLAASTNPEDIAKLIVYELIRIQRQVNPKAGPKKLLQHFKGEADFKTRLKEAGLKLDDDMFFAAIKWIGSNSKANT